MDEKSGRWFNGATLALNAILVVLAYAQSPFFEANRAQLTHEVHYSNTNEPVDGRYEGRAEVVIRNRSRIPAKDVYVVLKSLNDGSGWSFTSEHHVEEVPQSDKTQKAFLFKTVPANSDVRLECKQLVDGFEKRAVVDLFAVEPPTDCGYVYVYSPKVTNVYSDFGAVVELKHKSTACVCRLADDCLNEMQQANAE